MLGFTCARREAAELRIRGVVFLGTRAKRALHFKILTENDCFCLSIYIHDLAFLLRHANPTRCERRRSRTIFPEKFRPPRRASVVFGRFSARIRSRRIAPWCKKAKNGSGKIKNIGIPSHFF